MQTCRPPPPGFGIWGLFGVLDLGLFGKVSEGKLVHMSPPSDDNPEKSTECQNLVMVGPILGIRAHNPKSDLLVVVGQPCTIFIITITKILLKTGPPGGRPAWRL